MTASKHINTRRFNLIDRNGHYSIRKVVPSDISPFVGQREFKLSLGQMMKCDAVRRINEISADFDEMIAQAREARSLGNNPLGVFSAFVQRHKNTVALARLNGSTGIHTVEMPKPVTFTEILTKWANVKGKDESDSTFKKFTRFMNELAEHAGTDDAKQITAKHVMEYEEKLKRERSLHVNTISNMLACYKALFRFAKRRELLEVNRLADIEVPAKIETGKKGYSQKQVQEILARAKTDLREELFLISLIQAYTATRVSEPANLKVSQIVQAENGIWCVSLVVNTTKTKKARIIPLHDAVTAVLLPYIEREGMAPDSLLFPKLPRGKNGKAPPSVYASRELGDFIRNKLGKEDESFKDPDLQPNHSYRRYVLSRLKNAGVDETDRKRIGGHGEGISDLYQDKDIEALAKAIATLPTLS